MSNHPSLSISEHAQKHYKEYAKRDTSMQDVFEQTLKIVQELQSRVGSEMFRGMQYKDAKEGFGIPLDSSLVKSAQGLGTLVVRLQGLHMKMLKEGELQASKMSLEEQMKYVVNFVKKLPPGYKQTLIQELDHG